LQKKPDQEFANLQKLDYADYVTEKRGQEMSRAEKRVAWSALGYMLEAQQGKEDAQ
jgi:hypothetical protein